MGIDLGGGGTECLQTGEESRILGLPDNNAMHSRASPTNSDRYQGRWILEAHSGSGGSTGYVPSGRGNQEGYAELAPYDDRFVF